MIIILCVFSSACLVSARRNAVVDKGSQMQVSKSSSALLRMFRYLVHDPNKHSGVGFKRLRHPTLNHPCKDTAVFLELQLYVSWDILSQTCPQTPWSLVGDLLLKVQPSNILSECLSEPNRQTTLIFEDKDDRGPRAREIQLGAICSITTQPRI